MYVLYLYLCCVCVCDQDSLADQDQDSSARLTQYSLMFFRLRCAFKSKM